LGGFLVIALAVPHAYEGDGLAFGLGYLVVVLLHAGMFARGASVSEVRAILRIVPFNLVGVGLVFVGGALGGDWQWALWALAGGLLWVSPQFTTVEGFVVIGAGAAGLPLDRGLTLVALLALSLSAALWWLYFSDQEEVERAFEDAPPERRPQLALNGFGYWHYGILLGVVALAAGLKKAIGDPYAPLGGWIAVGLAAGAALFILCEIGFRRTFGVPRNRIRLVTAAAVLATLPLGTELNAAAQVGAMAALVAAALAAERRLEGRRGPRV
jgi:low temperature requirement protein LtrA